ncbi:MAG: FMN-binding protein [Eubacterium sp.]|nr:FMN-binding protein [Eubacterium sp.]
MVALIAVVALLCIYQVITVYRIQADEIAKLECDVDSYEATIESYKEATGTESEESSGFKDGSYTGSAQGFGGNIDVTVVVDGGKIESINIDSASGEDTAYLDMAVKVIDDIIDTQSLDVDSVSGATYSSNGIKNAVISALEQAI